MAQTTYDHASKLESNEEGKGDGSIDQLERLKTAGGHVDDRSQPSLPVVHRRLANPSCLGLLSFATGRIAQIAISMHYLQVRRADSAGRHFPHFHIWCQGPWHHDTQRPSWCLGFLWRSLPIHLRYHGVCLWQHSA